MKIDKKTTQDDDTLSLTSMAGDMEISIEEQQPGIESECSEIGKLINAYFYEYEN